MTSSTLRQEWALQIPAEWSFSIKQLKAEWRLNQLPALGNLPLIPLFQRSMNKIIVRGGIVLAILLALGSLQGCFGLQRASGCSNPGILGCKDKGPEPSEIAQPPAGLKRAPPGGRAQRAPVGDGRYLEGHEWVAGKGQRFCIQTRRHCDENYCDNRFHYTEPSLIIPRNPFASLTNLTGLCLSALIIDALLSSRSTQVRQRNEPCINSRARIFSINYPPWGTSP